ncbi:hypothetical protein [Candidatus Protochlamydia phocaeensis]|uniref:hypothetical protein n=1 Tax=Candidatus Protochlamydia phocaeensis TaxID=1414722 RepID=UPI000837F6B0|nr:hypothetical protein [Candidatus Protochlamydia phocaeensis]
MNDVKIHFQEFIDTFKESLGVEGAEQLLKQTLIKAGIPRKYEFTKEEALKICRELKQHTGFIGIIGGILNSRILIR